MMRKRQRAPRQKPSEISFSHLVRYLEAQDVVSGREVIIEAISMILDEARGIFPGGVPLLLAVRGALLSEREDALAKILLPFVERELLSLKQAIKAEEN